MIRNLRIRAEKDIPRKYGFGMYLESGCLGSTWGEPGHNYLATLTIVLFIRAFNLHISWKNIPAQKIKGG